MSVRVQIKESLEASVEFWGTSEARNVKPADAPKLRYFEVHPTKSLVLAADRDGKIILWDYSIKKTLISSSVTSLIVDRANQADMKKDIKDSAVSSNRLTKNASATLAGNLSAHTSSSQFLPMDGNAERVFSLSGNLAPAVLSKIKQQVGQVNQVCFADAAYMLSHAGLGGRNSNTFLHAANSETVIAIVCDSMVLFHDYVTNETTCVSNTELSKATATSVELAFVNTALIGCSDGVIRMWDWTYTQGAQQNANNASSALGTAPTAKGAVVMAMQTHSKSEVIVVKALPVRK